MAKINKKVLGYSRGKVADVVFAKFRTETIARGYQPQVRNPRTEKQQLQRARFTAMTNMAKGLVAGIYAGLGDLAQGTKMSPRNLFSKLNLNTDVFTGVQPDNITIDYSKVIMSKGGFEVPTFGTIDTDTPLTVEFTVSSPVTAAGADTAAIGVIYCDELGQAIVKEVISTVGKISVTVPASWNGLKVQVWGFYKYDGATDVEHGLYSGMKSNSVYVGNGYVQ